MDTSDTNFRYLWHGVQTNTVTCKILHVLETLRHRLQKFVMSSKKVLIICVYICVYETLIPMLEMTFIPF